MMDYGAGKFWLEMAAFLANGLVWLYVWRVRRDMATVAKITEIEAVISANVADNGVRLARMDERLHQAIGAAELKPIYDRLNNMNESISKIDGKMHTLDLIHEMMLNEGRKS